MDEILALLRRIRKEALELIIYQLMTEGKITYHDITALHVEHLEVMRKGESENFSKLRAEVYHLYRDAKKNRDKNLKAIMHRFVDEGWVAMTHEQIDKR